MKKKLVSVIMAATFAATAFAGCGGKDNPPAPTPGGDAYVPSEKEQTQPLVFGIDGADGVFSPFFSTAAYDTEITGMTQIGMLTSKGTNYAYGDDEACVVKDLDITYLADDKIGEVKSAEKAKYTRYDFLIKKGIKFSDGADLTIKDILFNLYVYLDPAYTGSATLYSTDIVGLKQYRTQSADENASYEIEEQAMINANNRQDRIYNWLNNQYLLSQAGGKYENLTPEQKAQYDNNADAYAEEIAKDLKYFLPRYRVEIENDYGSAQSSFTESQKEYAYDDGEFWQAYFYMYGIVKRKQKTGGGDMKDEQGRFILDFDAVTDYMANYVAENWQSCDGATEAEKKANAKKQGAIAYVFSATVGEERADGTIDYNYDKFKYTVIGSATTSDLYTEMLADERSKIIKSNEQSNVTKSISGVTYSKVTSFRNEKDKKTYSLDGEYDQLSILVNKIDPKAIWNFAFTVAPLHYYSYEGAGSDSEWNVNNNFGVVFNSTDFMNDVLKASEKLGVPVGAGVYKATNATGDLGGKAYPARNEFKNSNRIYYERNTYFDLLDGVENGGTIQNAKVKYFQYKVVNSNLLVDSLATKEIDVGSPSATSNTTNELNKYAFLKSERVLTNGYGYVGINAAEIPDVWMRRAIIKAMDTKTISQGYYKGGLCELIYRPMSTQSWAYPADKTTSFSFTDDEEYFVDYAFDETGKDIVQMLEDHGYEVNGEGKVVKDADGNALKQITFTVAGETDDHPAWQMFKQAERVLESVGFDIDVKTDAFALKKLASGQLSVWAAAWSSTIDPDMYQVYHKDSTAGSTLNWGYNAIKKDKSKYSYEWKVIDELSKLIDKGRQSIDNSKNGTRAQVYRKALDKVMELAVEMPTYQRNDLTVYNGEKIDSSTLNQNPTAYDGLFSRIWEVGYTK